MRSLTPPTLSGGLVWASDVLKRLSDVPIAGVAPVVHGRWKYYHKQGIAVCISCSFERKLDDNFGRAISCPNCCAVMDKEE